MDFVYKNGVVLCTDIKPQNVLLAPDETGLLVAKIADFGLAKSTFNDLEIGVKEGLPCILRLQALSMRFSFTHLMFGHSVVWFSIC